MKNPIISRTYYRVNIRLKTPLAVSNGENIHSDADIIRTGDGSCFVPGTTIAGAFRAYLGDDKDKPSVYGYSKGEEGWMSQAFFSDLYFEENSRCEVGVRDRVSLDDGKIVTNKFDLEAIETGAKGFFVVEAVTRKADPCTSERLIDAIEQGFMAMQEGEIRIGADKNRGFGRIEIESISTRSFDANKLEEWLDFTSKRFSAEGYVPEISYQNWMEGRTKAELKVVKLEVPLRLQGGISIRRYSTRPDQADFEHLTCNGMPVIPGSSWSGAIRSDIRRILKELGARNVDKMLYTWFGHVKVKSGKGRNVNENSTENGMLPDAEESLVSFGESILEDAKPVPMTRSKINRFSGGTVSGALYSEIAYFGGKTTLEILVRKNEKRSYEALMALLLMAIDDLQRGMLSVGGQTAVGRGIFMEDGENSVRISEHGREAEWNNALYEVIKGGKTDENR